MYSTYHLSRDAYLSAIVVVRDRLKNRIAMTPAMRASALDDQAISDFVSDYYDQRFVGYDCIPVIYNKNLVKLWEKEHDVLHKNGLCSNCQTCIIGRSLKP